MQRSRALAGLLNPGRCYSQRTRCLSTKSPFASFISDIKIPEETRRLSSLGDIEIPSSIPSNTTTSLFAARVAQREKRLQAEAAAKRNESSVTNTSQPTQAPSHSVISRHSQRLHAKDEERPTGGGSSRQQTNANVRPRRPSDAVTSSARVNPRADRRREGSRVAKPSRVVEPAIVEKTLPDDLALETTAPPVLHVNFDKTDLSRLFSSPVPTQFITRQSVAQSHLKTRMQLLKERAGDYSRYLQGDTDPTALTVGSIDYAKLILARKRDVGMKPRHTAVEMMQEAGVNSTSVPTTSS
ncbi:hypothetical protein K503DRAFT_855591 [Rhizopogon vinicolor AM-OR11-026]|uniref:Uncharacterized protein n=1 Tax=Rhizopogon vinicolor AM-OR11-026 TaxID=1314800 RepID=A0A1B7N5B9_9AGAM|nr:hypothetical protein K503DRAFT_855591 [Rhizopogon vinicolor AM-OR11-026]